MYKLLLAVLVAAQWLSYPTPRAPRTKDGKVDLSAPAPRMPDGKPDLSGVWTTARAGGGGRRGAGPGAGGGQLNNIGASLPGGVLPYPDFFLRAYGLPHYLKFIQNQDVLVMLNEMNAGYRQIFMDGRALPADPNPSWQGYSSAKWDGDALVVDTAGFRDDLWLDWNGSVVTSAGKIRERFRRPDFGHIDIEVTVDDPKAYTKPWTVMLHEQFAADVELNDEICLEGEKDAGRLR